LVKRYTKVLTAAFVLVLLIGVCGGFVHASSKVRIALVLARTTDDMAWSQSMYEALLALQNQLGKDKMELVVSERLGNPVDAGAAIRQYADQGFDIVIAHGAQFQAVVFEVAEDFPKTSFAYGSAFKTAPNVFAYEPLAQQGAYLNGMLAGFMTKTGTVAIVGPVESGDAVKYNYGFEQGVIAANPKANFRIAYTGSFGDVVGAGELAKVHMDAGADFLSGSAQQAVGAVRACAERPGVYWMATDMDQSSLAPDTVLAAQVYHWEKLVADMLELRKQGVMGGKHLYLSFVDDTLEFRISPRLADKIPADVIEKIEKAKQEIIDGTLVVELPTGTK
jgi:basic membrane protein A